MTAAQLNALKADFLEWTGGFEPECVEHIEAYVTTSMPFNLTDDEAREVLRRWMEQSASIKVRRDVDQH